MCVLLINKKLSFTFNYLLSSIFNVEAGICTFYVTCYFKHAFQFMELKSSIVFACVCMLFSFRIVFLTKMPRGLFSRGVCLNLLMLFFLVAIHTFSIRNLYSRNVMKIMSFDPRSRTIFQSHL